MSGPTGEGPLPPPDYDFGSRHPPIPVEPGQVYQLRLARPDGPALVRAQARVRVAWATGEGVQAEGVVIGYLDQPSLVIRRDDGTHVHVAISCPLTVLDQQ